MNLAIIVQFLVLFVSSCVLCIEQTVGVDGSVTSTFGDFGINPLATAHIYRNLPYDKIFEHEMQDGNTLTSLDAVAIDTGRFTGRSPKDKYFVKRSPSSENIWWGSVNQEMKPETFDKLKNSVVDHFNQASKIYVFDGFAGSSPLSRRKVRFISEIPWQHHFVSNMFIRPTSEKELEDFVPDFTIINGAAVSNPDWKADGLNSEVFVSFDIENKLAIIGGTYYGGEMKKGIFSMMNYWLPLQDIMSMHCSANIGKDGDTTLYFGLSGTGKTTLSTDPDRMLIGDDEHGWDENGVFNFEGGCYAKTVDLSEATEPEIYRSIKRDALLENVVVKADTKEVDFFDKSKTENGRVSYPIYHIPNYKPDSMGGHPKTIFFLACDAFGVLPPISKLTPEQAMYHFLSGYTAKVAGTELGVKEPSATFSACFGAAFLVLHPTKYADLLRKKLELHGTQVYLVNTGWSGGAYGVGKRMSIRATRAAINAVLDGSIRNAVLRTDERFGFQVPVDLPGVPKEALNPVDSWSDKAAFEETANKLADMFKKNFVKFVQPGMTDYTPFGPK